MNEPLSLWLPGPTRDAVLDFVARVTDPDTGLPAGERLAVFDNDGTLWCEMPAPVQLGFLLGRMVEMAGADPRLRERQPWKAAHEGDLAWFGAALTKHYSGDDTDAELLNEGVLSAFADISVEEFARQAEAFLRTTEHPTLGRPYLRCAYAPMVQLLGYLEENGFATYIVSGGGRDFMRPVTGEVYGIPSERVIGSSNALRWIDDEDGGTVRYQASPDVFDDGPVKPVRIWSRIGRRPILAAGNSNGDVPMLRYAGGPSRPGLRLLVLHDDDDREFAYTAGAEDALAQAAALGWTVASIQRDWALVFADDPNP
jgi:phosphoserine phosphatase